jgi:N-acetylmuramic acid 6-phosphate etherase
MNQHDVLAALSVRSQLPAIARVIDAIASRMRRGGRLVFVGAGTSGRLGVLEAAECPPTFSTSPDQVQAVMAGGRGAVFRSREGAEDARAPARQALKRVRPLDIVVGTAASGVTPFVDEALAHARRAGALTVLITAHPGSPIVAQHRIVLRVSPELLTGSTRLKTATATKLVLNMLTLGVMVRLGKTYGNLMVDVRPNSDKLRARAGRIVEELTGLSSAASSTLLRRSGGEVKAAIIMARLGCSRTQAASRLRAAGGSLRDALNSPRGRRRAS